MARNPRILVNLPDEHLEHLKEISKETGASINWLIRRAVELYLSKPKMKKSEESRMKLSTAAKLALGSSL